MDKNEISNWDDWVVDLHLQPVPCFLTPGFDFSMDQISFSLYVKEKNLHFFRSPFSCPFGKEFITIVINNITPSRSKLNLDDYGYFISVSINPRKELKRVISYDEFIFSFKISQTYLEEKLCGSNISFNSLEFCADSQTNVNLIRERHLNTSKQILHCVSEALVNQFPKIKQYWSHPEILYFDSIEYGQYACNGNPLTRNIRGTTLSLCKSNKKRKTIFFSIKMYQKSSQLIRFEICLRKSFLLLLGKKNIPISKFLLSKCREGLDTSYYKNKANKRKKLIQDYRNFFRKKAPIFPWKNCKGGGQRNFCETPINYWES